MSIKYLLPVIIGICILAGCKEDDVDPTCENYAVNLGPFYLDQSSRDLFPYSGTDSTLVFKNQLDEELILTLGFYRNGVTTFNAFGKCPFDSLSEVPYVIDREYWTASFINDSLNWHLQFNFSAGYSYKEFEVIGEHDAASLFFFEMYSNLVGVLSSPIINKSGQQPSYFNQYHNTITLGTKTFEKVYSNIDILQNPLTYILYMNYELGIVGIENTLLDQVWVFDRIE